MSIIGLQILGVIFGFLMMYITYLTQKREVLDEKEGLFWIISWGILILVSIFPMTLDFLIKNLLQLERRLDFYVVVGIIFMLGITFNNYVRMRKTERKIEKLVRKIALK